MRAWLPAPPALAVLRIGEAEAVPLMIMVCSGGSTSCQASLETPQSFAQFAGYGRKLRPSACARAFTQLTRATATFRDEELSCGFYR